MEFAFCLCSCSTLNFKVTQSMSIFFGPQTALIFCDEQRVRLGILHLLMFLTPEPRLNWRKDSLSRESKPRQ